MLILLPPSETKRIGGRYSFSGSALSNDAVLATARREVRDALVAVSGDEEAAVKALKLGKKNRAEREYNLQLDDSGAMPAIERYTGVLYDALAATELDTDARAWVDGHVAVQSALFGLVHAHDLIPAYRLSASSRLPALGRPLAKVWADQHRELLNHTKYVLDMRSKDYAALAPLDAVGAGEADFVEVVARSDDGEVRALNHFNKAAKGELVRRLAESAPVIEHRADLLAWCNTNGIEMTSGEEPGTLRLVAQHGVPALSR